MRKRIFFVCIWFLIHFFFPCCAGEVQYDPDNSNREKVRGGWVGLSLDIQIQNRFRYG